MAVSIHLSLVLVYLQSVTKDFAKIKKIKQNWTRPENFHIYFCISLDKLNFGEEAGH